MALPCPPLIRLTPNHNVSYFNIPISLMLPDRLLSQLKKKIGNGLSSSQKCCLLHTLYISRYFYRESYVIMQNTNLQTKRYMIFLVKFMEKESRTRRLRHSVKINSRQWEFQAVVSEITLLSKEKRFLHSNLLYRRTQRTICYARCTFMIFFSEQRVADLLD